ncbi:hypothetical protein HNV11_14785 [Spirosoma taeanense]|uniref:YXWGXW repeat-containing protein n=1 Tax=Spirosoma taeanense TaxID=2735870 RepID=A0A6M5Y989_9BACT|nr:DUF6600 domain-containing protein [Spirosoma taeanense]QJW90555.1 hypothetical protein HNV11_14785 [Spirosoma taeanense]
MGIPNIIIRLGIMAMLVAGPSLMQSATAQPGYSMAPQTFYNELAPYGQWLRYPGYGDVWLPNAGPDFQPYATAGHWVVTEFGNTWVSDYPWGWAPFHYGRWIFDGAYGGWLWIPGSDWGPAWVSWRSGGGYYGWAPLGPGVDINVNINIPAPYWTFVPQAYITSPRLYSYRVPRPNVVNIYQNTTIINNIYRINNRAYVYGPQHRDIEYATRRSVPVYRIDNLDRPGRSVVGDRSVRLYRPDASRGSGREYGQYQDRFDNSPGPAYGNNSPNDRRGSYSNETSPYGGNNRTYDNRADRRGSNRGDYGQQSAGGYPQQTQPERRYESPERSQPNVSQPNQPYSRGQRSEGNYQQRMPESRGADVYPQRGQAQQRSQEGGQRDVNPGGRGSRGPR